MKYFNYLSFEYEQEYELYQKTRKNEIPKHCDGCEKRIKKGMYYSECDAGESYCLECCTEKNKKVE